MPACTDDTIERRWALRDFDLLLQRPRNYFELSPDRQWEEDRLLGALDAWVPTRYITNEMRAAWKDRFGVDYV